MQRTEKNSRGRLVVVVILVLAVLTSGATWFLYAPRHPVGRNVRVLDARSVTAEFDSAAVPRLREGMLAMVSQNDGKFSARLGPAQASSGEGVFLLVLEGPGALVPDAMCKVSVDTTIPPEFLRPPEANPN